MQIKFVLVIFILLINSIVAQNPDKQIQSTVSKIYNFNFEKADSELDAFTIRFPNDYRGYYYKSMMNLWFFLGSLNEAYKDSFDFYSDKVKTILEKSNGDKQSEIIKKLFWLGMIEYNKSVASARANDFASAILSLKNMRNRLEEAIRLNPEFYDAYLPIGLSNFAFAEVPAALKWAANLVGFNSDKELGLEYLQLVADKGSILKTDALFYLSQIYSRVIIEHQEADKILSKLTKTYPKNLLFNYSSAWIKYELNDLNSSEKILRSILSSNDKIFPYVISNSHLLLANIFFAKEQYDSAMVHYNLFRDNRVNNDYSGLANLRTGICYELLGNRNQAIKFYEKSDEGNKDLDEDIYAEKLGKLFASKPINDDFKFILHIKNLIKQKKLKDAEEILKDVLAENKYSNRVKSESYLLLSDIYLMNKKFEDALEQALQCIKLNASKDNTIAANSYYNAALALVNLNREDEAIDFLEKIEQTDDFDFQTLLKNKAYTLRRKIVKASD
jgi:tetratricopeptide (TPR) repeat protein